MPKKIDDVIGLLKKEGVEIGDEAAAAAQKEFSGQVLASPDRLVGEDQISVSEKAFEELKADMHNYKNKLKKSELNELKHARSNSSS